MRRALKLAATALAMGAFLSASAVEAQTTFQFPHEKHSVFFSDCTACHAGIPSEEFGGAYPELSTCAACHDGNTAPGITWTPPKDPRVSSLAFKHDLHAFDCATCHVTGEAGDLSSIGMPNPTTCLGCHAPQAENHLAAQGACLTCHIPAWKSGISTDKVSGLPKPASHMAGDFTNGHRALAAGAGADDCAVCHTEASCTTCHEGQGAPAFHPINFLASHGPEAFGRTSDCSTCHNAEAFCRACHSGLGVNASGGAGVAYHTNEGFWILSHAPAARQDLESCVSCHQQTDCLRCHSAQLGLGVSPHGPDFNGSSISERNRAMCTLCHISGN